MYDGMLRARKVILGTLVLALLSATAVVALLLGEEIVAGVAVVLMVLIIGVIGLHVATALDRAERQLQKLAKAVRGTSPAKPAPESPEPGAVAGEADLLGTVRLLQAQYVGRLDRAQATLEAAAEQLSVSDGHRN